MPQTKQILQMLPQPSFLVYNGSVTWCNHAAQPLLSVGTPLSSLLEQEDTLFSQWNHSGTLQIPIVLSGLAYQASVCALEDADLFVAIPQESQSSDAISAMLSSSAALRRLLHTLLGSASLLFEQLTPEEGSKAAAAAARMTQSVYQLIRLCGQMSGGMQLLTHTKAAMRTLVDINEFLAAFFKQAEPLVASSGRTLLYRPADTPLHASADTALLERALYNLLSNAMNYTSKGGTILLSTKRVDMMLLITVSDDGEGIAENAFFTAFARYSRHTPSDYRQGLGMGLSIVREIARLHGGTLMVSSNSPHGTVATFSISLKRLPLEVHSFSIPYDYCGKLNHGLVELSDVLEAEMFGPGDVL